MKQSQSTGEEKRPEPKWIRGENTPLVYANAANIRLSVYDMQLTLGRNQVSANGGVEVVEVVRVAMSPQHVKTLAKALSRSVTVYEERFGPIPETTEHLKMTED